MNDIETDDREQGYQPPTLVEVGRFSEDTLGNGMVRYFEISSLRYLI